MKHTYIAQQGQSGEYTLIKDNIPAMCPKLMYPLVQFGQTNLGQPVSNTQLNRLPCSTACPFAEISQSDDGKKLTDPPTDVHVYTITCEGGCKSIVLDDIKLFEKKEAPPLIKV